MPTSTQRFRLVGEDDASKTFLQVAAASKLMKSNIDDVNKSFLGLGKLVGGADLVPLLAGTAAATLELSTSLTAAAGAAGVFGLSAVGFVLGMSQQQEQIGKLQIKLKSLSKDSSTYGKTLDQLHTAQASFNKDFGPTAKGFHKLQDAYSKFEDKTRPITQGVLVKGMDLLAKVLPKLVPVSNAAGKAIGGIFDEMIGGVNGPGFAHFLDFLETSGPKDFTAFAHIIGNTIGGLGGIFSNFVGPGDHAAKTLEHLTADFDKWGHSKGVSKGVDSFLRYVGNNGPALSSSLKSLADATPKIATALGKIGSANLTLTSKFLSLVAGLPQKQFNLIADSLFALAAGSKALTLVTGLGAVGKGLAGILSGKGLVGKGSSILSRGGGAGIGVQKVFVVNMPPGGPGGGVGGKGFAPIAGAPAVEAAGATALAGVAAAAAIALPFTALMLEVNAKTPPISSQFARDPGIGRGGPKAIAWAAAHGDPNAIAWLQMQANPAPRSASLPTGGRAGGVPLPPFIQATSTKLDALNARLGKASQGMDLVGHSALRAFPNATKVVENTSAKLEALNGAKGEQAFDLIGNSASRNTASAGRNIDVLTGKLNHIPNRDVKIGADTSQALSNVRIMQQQVDALHGKTIIIRTTGGRVLTGDGSNGGPGSGTGSGASGGSDTHHHSTTNNITIVAPAVGDPVSIGEQVAYYLGEFQAAG